MSGLPEAKRRILEFLIGHHPHAVERPQIDAATNYQRSSRDAYLQRLGARVGEGLRPWGQASDRMFEVESSKLAVQKAEGPVKGFATQMVAAQIQNIEPLPRWLESPLARYLVDYRLYSFISNPDEGRCVGAVLATKTVRFLTINANAPVSHRIAGPNTTPLERAEEPDKIEITLDQKDAGGGLPSLQKGTDCHWIWLSPQRPSALSPALLPIKRYSKFLALDADGSPTGAFFTWSDADTMRTFADKYDWLPIDTAPWEEDVTLLVTDGRGEPYRIPYPCKLTASGWVNSPKGTLLEVTAMNWKPYRPAPKR